MEHGDDGDGLRHRPHRAPAYDGAPDNNDHAAVENDEVRAAAPADNGARDDNDNAALENVDVHPAADAPAAPAAAAEAAQPPPVPLPAPSAAVSPPRDERWAFFLLVKLGLGLALWADLPVVAFLSLPEWMRMLAAAIALRSALAQSLGRVMTDVVVVESEKTALELERADLEQKATELARHNAEGAVEQWKQAQLQVQARRRQDRMRRIRRVYGERASAVVSGATAGAAGLHAGDPSGSGAEQSADTSQRELMWRQPVLLRYFSRAFGTGSVAGLSESSFSAPIASGAKEVLEERCTICFCEFAEGDNLAWMRCCHVFHSDCISMWLKEQPLCPVCRLEARNETFNTQVCGEHAWLAALPTAVRVDSGITARNLRILTKGWSGEVRLLWGVVWGSSRLRAPRWARLALFPLLLCSGAIALSRLMLTSLNAAPFMYGLLAAQTLAFLYGYWVLGSIGVTLSVFLIAGANMLTCAAVAGILRRSCGSPLPSELTEHFDLKRIAVKAMRRVFTEFNFMVEGESGNTRIPALYRTLLSQQYARLVEEFMQLPVLPSELVAQVEQFTLVLRDQRSASQMELSRGNHREANDLLIRGLQIDPTFSHLAASLRESRVHELDREPLVTSEATFWRETCGAMCQLADIFSYHYPPSSNPQDIVYIQRLLSGITAALEAFRKRGCLEWPAFAGDEAESPLDSPAAWVARVRRAQVAMVLFTRLVQTRRHGAAPGEFGLQRAAPLWSSWPSGNRFSPEIKESDAMFLLARAFEDVAQAARCCPPSERQALSLGVQAEVEKACLMVEAHAELCPGVARAAWLRLVDSATEADILPYGWYKRIDSAEEM